MADVTSIIPLSASVDGAPVKVAATASPGTDIHAAAATGEDRVEIWATNTSASPVDLTIQWGGTTAPDNSVILTLPPKNGLALVIPTLVLRNSKAVKAFAATANVVLVMGQASRRTPG